MKRFLLLSIFVIMVMVPGMVHAIEPIQLDIVGGSVGFPWFWEAHLLGVRTYPVPGNTVFSRLGIQGYLSRYARFYVDDQTQYTLIEMFPLRLCLLVYPGTIKTVSLKSPFYAYLYAGMCISANVYGSSPAPESWAGGKTTCWNAGAGFSFKGVVELDVGYVTGNVDEYLTVNARGYLIEYSPGFEFNRIYASLKLTLGTAVASWK